MMNLKLLLPLLISFNFCFAQSTVSNEVNCVEGFSFSTKKVSGQHPSVDDIVVSWDFSGVSQQQDLELILEVQPLNACWQGLEGTERSSLKSFKPVYFSEHPIGSQSLEYMTLNCKCFKWRATIINKTNACKTVTKWHFTSFL